MNSLRKNLAARDTAYKHLRQTKLKIEESLKSQTEAHAAAMEQLTAQLEEAKQQLAAEQQKHNAALEVVRSHEHKMQQLSNDQEKQQQQAADDKAQVQMLPPSPIHEGAHADSTSISHSHLQAFHHEQHASFTPLPISNHLFLHV